MGDPQNPPFDHKLKMTMIKRFSSTLLIVRPTKLLFQVSFFIFASFQELGEGLFEQESCEETIHSLTLFVGGGTIGDKIGLK